MSLIFTTDQQPLTITPTNTEHIYTFSTASYTLPSFKYIVDIYFFPSIYQSGYTETNRVARLKIAPNEYGKAIIEVNEIIRTLLKANPRSAGNTYPYLNYVADENSVITLMNAQQTTNSNAFNYWPGGSPNGNLDQLFHVGKYQAIVGAEYISGTTLVEDIIPTASFQPRQINIFPGVDNKLIPEPTLWNATIGNGGGENFFSLDTQGWYYYDLFRHQYNTQTISSCNPKEFFNVGKYNTNNVAVVDGVVQQNTRRRKHHPDCPIILSFLNGKNDYFTNDVYSIVTRASLDYGTPYTFSAESQNRTTTTTPTTNEPSDSLFKYLTFYLPYNITASGTNTIPVDAKKLGFYGVAYQNTQASRMNYNNATTELLEYYIQDRDCLASPIHLLFLNSNGVWDTYTFGGKSQRSFSVERKQYRQQMSLNKQFYSRGSSNRGTTIYEHDADEFWSCKSWYMEDSDVDIVESLFLSPEVYIITGTTIPPQDCQSCLDEILLYEYLIPVVIEDKNFTEIKKRYNKLYQYEFNLKYAGLKRFRLQG